MGKRKAETREEQRARLMREIGNWYLVEENGKPHEFVIQYHIRGVWPEDELDEINAFLDKADDLEEIVKFLRKHDARYLVGDLDKMAAEAQKADDQRKDVSSIIKKHLAPIPGDTRKAIQMIKKVGWSRRRIYNVGNVHIDHRMVEPGGRYLIGWTHDIPKVAVQNLRNEFFFPLRDRFLDWKPGDQWMAQQKLAQPLAWLTIVTPGKMIYQADPGEVGATAETAGYFIWKASGHVAYGCQKSDYHEYWLKFEKPFKRIMRVDIKLIETPGNYKKAPLDRIWLVAPPPYKQDTPYIMHHKYEVEAEKAKRDKIEMIWNEKVLDILLKWGVITRERIEREASIPKRPEVNKFYIAKMDEELQVVKGFVLLPNKVDRQRDYISAREIEKAAHRFLLKGPKVRIEHSVDAPMVKVVESAIIPVDIYFGGYHFPAGSWWLALKVFDKELWHKIKSGVYKAFSIGGFAKRLKREGVVDV